MPATHPLAPFRRGVSRVLRRRPRLTDAIDWMYRFPVITITRRHPPIYVKGRPYFVSKENPSNRLPHLHCSRSCSWEASYSSTCGMGMPMPLEGAVWAQALILGASVAGILALAALLRPPQAQIRAPFTETAGSITSRRPSSDPPSYSERFDARLLRSVHRPHDQRNTKAAPSQSGSPSLRDVFA